MDSFEQFIQAVRKAEDELEVNLPTLALVTPERMQRQLEEGLPLLPLVPPEVPVDDFLAHLATVRDLLVRFSPDLALDMRVQEEALGSAAPEVTAAIFSALLHGDNGALFDQAEALGIAPERLYFLGELALRPFLMAYAERLESVLDFSAYVAGRCPVCGRRPLMGRIDSENVKYLHCQACEASWRVPRIACTTCGSTETEKLGFFTVEGKDEVRVEHCGECGDYMKVVNQRVRFRKLDFLVEDAASVHLDQLAEAEGYVRGGRNKIAQ